MLRRCLPILFVSVLVGVAVYHPHRISAASREQATTETTDSRTNIPLSLVYTNKGYRFHFHLPESWKGYSIVVGTWDGFILDENGDSGREMAERGPTLAIRHPLWTEANPYQDIPIMIFTRAQWQLTEHGHLIVSAAPVGPQEIGRNRKYVFALPPRYNYADAIGIEEVGEIVSQHPLRSF
jgi:hypothetical protein